jgi:uncharacterized membrane protein
MAASIPPLRSLPDRVRQAVAFEISGILLIGVPFAWASGQAIGHSFALLTLLSLIAALWNGIYSTLFDHFEGRHTGRSADRRPAMLRILHAVGFEGGLMAWTLPLIMQWTGMGLRAAFLADVALAVVYTAYAYFFNLAYDRLFPIPPTPDAS